MTELRKDVFVLINTFRVDPARQDEVIRVLEEATESVMRKQPGFVSASFHKSFDGRFVANYAQWESKAAFEDMLNDPAAKEHMQKVIDLIESYEPIGYELVSTHSGGAHA